MSSANKFPSTTSESRRACSSRAQAMVEFALVLIVAMTVLFVSIQMALIGQAALALGQMNYQAARYAAANLTLGCTGVASYMASNGSPTVALKGGELSQWRFGLPVRRAHCLVRPGGACLYGLLYGQKLRLHSARVRRFGAAAGRF